MDPGLYIRKLEILPVKPLGPPIWTASVLENDIGTVPKTLVLASSVLSV